MKNVFCFEAMTTPCEVVIYHASKETARNIANEILIHTKQLESKYNYFDSNSLISQINKRTLQTLDPKTKDLLQRGKTFYNKTNKIFDITVATIKDLYRFEQNIEELMQKKEALKGFVGCEHFEIKRDKIVFDNPYTKIDLGGMVKEYAVDEGIKILQKHKIKSALINFGGDIFALGTKPDGSRFVVGIKNPANPTEHITTVALVNQALTTSANYERSYQIQNKQFSHILHLDNLQDQITSATAISSSTLMSGVYSTALMINHRLATTCQTILIDTKGQILCN